MPKKCLCCYCKPIFWGNQQAQNTFFSTLAYLVQQKSLYICETLVTVLFYQKNQKMTKLKLLCIGWLVCLQVEVVAQQTCMAKHFDQGTALLKLPDVLIPGTYILRATSQTQQFNASFIKN